MGLTYYYREEAEQFSFIRIPKAMMTEEIFSSLSMQAKLLYGLLLDKMGYSLKNKWIDEERKIYVIYTIAEIQEDMNISKKKAIACLTELVNIGLVEKKQRGLGLPSILYVKNFASNNSEV
ncbi:MAG: replication initiator protein A [Pseudobutyrivibrio sp.]|nr:replication initiator protein A [Pseudobutyrivibrio sp.]